MDGLVVSHALVEADNSEFLKSVPAGDVYGLLGQVDTLYLDPPYNTRSKDLTYQDSLSSDVWCVMMREVLLPAKLLLKPTGVVVVSIADESQHLLRGVMDDVFGAKNFIAQLVVDGGANKNNSTFFSVTHEYMVVYAVNLSALRKSGLKWRKERENVREVLTEWEKVKAAGMSHEQVTVHMKRWLKGQPGFSKRLKVFFNSEPRGLFTYADLSVPGNRYEYDVYHPVTGKKVVEPSRGWGLDETRFKQLVAEDMIIWGADETYQPLKKLFLSERKDQLMGSVLAYPARTPTHQLEKLIGRRSGFTNPKNLEMMKDVLDYVTPLDGVVLDYFAGSGTTLHAVLDLNAEQRNSVRRCVAVTNNEAGIFRDVAVPRIKAVLEQPGYGDQNVQIVYSISSQ